MKKKGTCQHCGAEFTFRECPSNKGKVGKYCSVKCRDAEWRRRGGIARRTARRVIKKCLHCQKEYKSLERQSRKYCSTKCFAAARHGKNTVTRACPICGEEFTQARSSRQIYCSKPCQTKGLRPYWDSLGRKPKTEA